MKYEFSVLSVLSLFISIALLACGKIEAPTVKTTEVIGINSTSAICGGEVVNEGSSPVTIRGVCWSENEIPTINDFLTKNGSGSGSFTSIITGIDHDKPYIVRAYATNNEGTGYGQGKRFTTHLTDPFTVGQIIADHTVVDDFDKIPAQWIDAVKKMHVYFPGASHSAAYRSGLIFLEASLPTYQINVGTAQPETDSYLRVQTNINGYVNEDYWYTWYGYPSGSYPSYADTIPNLIKAYHDAGYPFDVIGFGWCWDMVSSYASLTRDPVYKVRWMGTSTNGPSDNAHGFGLDSDDYSITGNPVSMDTYLFVTDSLQRYCEANGIDTKVVYTTGPVSGWVYTDLWGGEAVYQGNIKCDYIRDWVKADPSRILFDYEDILAYDDDGSMNKGIWTYDGVNYEYRLITETNEGDETTGHIGTAGAIRLAKAQWWMLARIAGWDGE